MIIQRAHISVLLSTRKDAIQKGTCGSTTVGPTKVNEIKGGKHESERYPSAQYSIHWNLDDKGEREPLFVKQEA